jgi:hypothetical protein
VITLGVLTGISPMVWAEMGGRAISTAFDVLRARYGGQADEATETERAPGRPIYSG